VKQVLESIGEGFLSVDADDAIVYLNQVGLRLLGITDRAVEGKNLWELFPDFADSSIPSYHATCKERQEAVIFEGHLPGTDRVMQVELYPTDKGGLTAYFWDVTEERHTRHLLRSSEQRLRAAEQMAAIGHWELNLETGTVKCSDGIVAMLALNGPEVHINKFFAMVHADDAERVESEFQAVMAEQTSYDDTFRFIATTGDVVHVHARSDVKEDERGNPCLFGITRDISKEVRAQQAAEASKQRLHNIFDSAMDAILTTDADHRIMMFNDAAQRMFGYEAEEIQGQPLSILLPEQFRAMHDQHVEEFGQSSSTSRRMGQLGSVYGLRRSGEQFPTEASISVVNTLSGPLYTVILRDITEQQAAQNALEESKEWFDLAIQGGNLGIFDWRPASNYMTWNDEGLALLGMSLEGVPQKIDSWLDRLHPEDLPRVIADNEQMVDGRAEQGGIQHRLRHSDGTYRWINPHSRVVSRDENGIANRIVGVFRDVTEQVEARTELEASEARYRSVVESIKEVIFEADTDGRWTYVNPAWQSLAGYTSDETVGRPFLDFVHPEDRAGCADRFEKILSEEKGACRAEVRFTCANGSIRWFEVNAWVVMDDDGQSKGVRGTLYDLTERRAAENALRSAKDMADRLVEQRTAELQRTNEKLQQMATLVDHAGDAIWVQNAEGTITYWNQSAEALYGWSWEEAVDANVQSLVYGENGGLHKEVQRLVEQRGAWTGELVHQTRTGRRVYVDSRWSRAVSHSPGTDESFLVVNTDITERKNLEQQVRRAQRMESLGKLAGSVAHDVNNVLGPILMSLEMLEATVSDDRSRRLINALGSGAERGAGLMRQLLSFARGSEGAPEVMPLEPVLDELRNMIGDTIPSTIETSFETAPDLRRVKGDATQLHQVFMNLVINAIDAMEEGGTLRICAENVAIDTDAPVHLEALPGTYVRVTVADTGAGIPLDLRDKIFDPFFTTKGDGTGLGLSTTLGIVRGHHGFIDVESEEGKGTTFSVYLPVADDKKSDAPATKAPVPMGQGQHILLAEDEVGLRLVTKRVLETHGYTVHDVANGAEAGRVLQGRLNDIALVITDVMMPVMDGRALVDLLRDLDSTIPVLAVSGLATKETVISEDSPQVKAFLAKPYRAHALLRTVHEVLTNAQEPSTV